MSELLIVAYHYVRDSEQALAGMKGLTLDRLREQLDALERAAEPLGPAELRARVAEQRPTGPAFVLTFDDGLAEHAALVAPELARRGLTAFFFVATEPWEGRVLRVHKTHLLLASDRIEALVERLNGRGEVDAAAEATAVGTYRYDDARTAVLKFRLNYLLSEDDRAEVVDGAFADVFGAEADVARTFYVDGDDCRRLVREGHEIGLHSHAHRPLATLEPEEVAADLTLNRRLLRERAGIEATSIAYPYGGPAAVDARVIGVAREIGLAVGFTGGRTFARPDGDPLALERVDTNDAPGGKRPQVAFGAKSP